MAAKALRRVPPPAPLSTHGQRGAGPVSRGADKRDNGAVCSGAGRGAGRGPGTSRSCARGGARPGRDPPATERQGPGLGLRAAQARAPRRGRPGNAGGRTRGRGAGLPPAGGAGAGRPQVGAGRPSRSPPAPPSPPAPAAGRWASGRFPARAPRPWRDGAQVPAMERCHYNESIRFFYNNSGKELSAHWRPKDALVVALGLTVSVLVLLANLLVIAAIASNRRLHQPIYYLLGNLAAADLFAGGAYLFLMLHTGPRTARLSLRGWFLRQGLLDASLTASVATLLAIAVERHRSVMAVQLHSRLPRGRVVLLIVGVWAAALGLGLLPVHAWHCLCALDRCSRMAPLLSRAYLAVWALSSLLVFLLMVAVYARIYFYVRRRVRRMAEHVSCHPRYRETTLGLVKTTAFILGAFVICWTPGQVVLLLDGLGCQSCNVLAVEKYFLLLAESNSLVNAVVYSCRDAEMRRTFRRLLCCRCLRRAAHEPARCMPSARSCTSASLVLPENGHPLADSTL
ncbi:lysophosphatidic acid receptor 2 [Dasypus novemcinctus]|uniref:lysophosphatidic acid receptor 2 n=1 Tax=Dasypus novemcinctus TaxID=9361 RepID=UPI00265F7F04|nr:lysophosphatidic acid receptor 2 [Dasypus novemcinctus]